MTKRGALAVEGRVNLRAPVEDSSVSSEVGLARLEGASVVVADLLRKFDLGGMVMMCLGGIIEME